ncbi:MAG: L-lactate MFS transporter [Planctomycetota bacterium]
MAVAQSLGEVHVRNKGWQVTLAAMGINLALGVLYSWSMVSKAIPSEWDWREVDKSWPYSVACLVFSLVMVPAGRMQDRAGPRLTATIGGLLVGAGMMLASLTTSPLGYMLGFGLLAGAGIGFGYASATPPAVKWFPPARTGLIAGLVVSGFGLASVYAAPLTEWLTTTKYLLPPQWYGVPKAMLVLGACFTVVVTVLAQFLVPPPAGYVPAVSASAAARPAARKPVDYSPMAMLGTWQFYVLWFMYACGAGAGLMVISKLAPLAESEAGLKLGFVLVAALAVGNGAGRVIAGVVSDRIGRLPTLFGCFIIQAGLMLALTTLTPGQWLADMVPLAIVSALIGANYGANLAVFPSITKDYYGLKNFGMNYGLVFTSWGVGGFVLALLAGSIKDTYGNYVPACYIAAGLLIAAAVATMTVRRPIGSDVSPQ